MIENGVDDEESATDRELIQLKLDHPNVAKLLHWEDDTTFR